MGGMTNCINAGRFFGCMNARLDPIFDVNTISNVTNHFIQFP